MEKNEAPRLALRPISSLFGDTWKLYKGHWRVLVEIVLLPTLITILGTVLIGLNLGILSRALGGLALFIGWVIFAYSVLPVVYALHHGMGVDASYKATIGWFWPYMWVAILQAFMVIGGFAMAFIPGIWLGIVLAFSAYIFVIEQRRGIDVLRQSKAYVKGYWWAVFGRVLSLAIPYLVAVMILQIPAALVGGRILSSFVSATMALLFFPFSAIYHYLIFTDLRERKPELSTVQTKAGTGFLKASAIVGVVALVVFMLFLYMLGMISCRSGMLVNQGGRLMPPPWCTANAQLWE